jgi:hypothetical protein
VKENPKRVKQANTIENMYFLFNLST